LNGAGKGFDPQGLTLVKFFFLCTFAAAVPAIVSGGIAERAKFSSQCVATALIVGLAYPFFEGIVWNKNYGLQEGFFKGVLGEEFHDFAGSIVVHAVGGWIGFAAVRQLGPRLGRYDKGRAVGIPPSSIPWLAMGSWLLWVGWFGFNVMSAQSLKAVSGLVAMNSLMAMCGGIIAALIAGDGDPGFIHNGALAGLVAVCAGSDVMHPIGSLFVGGVAGAAFWDAIVKPGALEAFDVAIPAAQLTSPKEGLDKNMHKALKAQQHADIIFRLLRFEPANAPGMAKAIGVLRIAGVEREVAFEVKAQASAATLAVSGSVDLLMTDYGISPPKAMLGMLKT
ncbi:MAG: YceI family protein, partial [Burkholderiales bacterium]